MSISRINIDYLARVEGETGLEVVIENNEVKDVKLNLFEPPRFFESFLIGRHYSEVPEIVSRICGICPVPHSLAAMRAIEKAFGLEPSEQTKTLRKLWAFGDWIQSHSLHIFMLALPDYLGYESVVSMAQNPELKPAVEMALSLKRLGNDLMEITSGREVHSISPAINGFTQLPSLKELKKIQERLKKAQEDALTTIKLVSGIALPDFVREGEHVSLHLDNEYAINEGRLVSNFGLDEDDGKYPEVIVEEHIPHSNAKHAKIKGRDTFLVGPLARVNNNFEQLRPEVKEIAKEAGFVFPSYNPFAQMQARALELMQVILESIRIIDELDRIREEDTSYVPCAGEAYAVVEAPRGICCHGYKINKEGVVEKADIVAPTARNAATIEKDIYKMVPDILNLSEEEATLRCEMLIRAYDPCFSCSVHNLQVRFKKIEK